MKVEIERKFLLAGDGWKAAVERTVAIRDGLIAGSNGHKARVRIADGEATIAIKTPRVGLSRYEFEYPIPLADAELMLKVACEDNLIWKQRHFVPDHGVIWEIDVYEGLLAGTVIAEVEMTSEHDDPVLPPWIGREITGHEEYRKINLLRTAIHRQIAGQKTS